jgi:hypothetical protein
MGAAKACSCYLFQRHALRLSGTIVIATLFLLRHGNQLIVQCIHVYDNCLSAQNTWSEDIVFTKHAEGLGCMHKYSA